MTSLLLAKCQNTLPGSNAVFNKLRPAVMKLKPSKFELFRKQINYLGHVVSSEGVSTDPKKILAVVEWPRSTI